MTLAAAEDSTRMLELPQYTWVRVREVKEVRGKEANVLRALVWVSKDSSGTSFSDTSGGWLTCHNSRGELLLDSGPLTSKEVVKKVAGGVGGAGVAVVGALFGQNVAAGMQDKAEKLGELREKGYRLYKEKVVLPGKQLVSDQIEDALRKNDEGLLTKLLDSALESGAVSSGKAPPMIVRAAQRIAVKELNAAIHSEDPKHLKGAIVMAGRLGRVGTPEYDEAVRKYRNIRKLPEGWSNLTPKQGMLVGRSHQDESMVGVFQTLFDSTTRKVYTRDRRGQMVPDRFFVHSVVEVQNADKWVDYAIRREEVQREMARALAVRVLTHEALRATNQTLTGPPLQREVNEVYLFHGTHPTHADKIADTSFQIDLSGSNAGSLYGRGVYFAENVSKSDEYSVPDGQDICTMLLCRVVLGNALYTDEVEPNPRKCEDSCIKGDRHSVIGDRLKARGTFREFVIFDEDQVYPNFLVTYSRVHATARS